MEINTSFLKEAEARGMLGGDNPGKAGAAHYLKK
jgi:hypothetical protein